MKAVEIIFKKNRNHCDQAMEQFADLAAWLNQSADAVQFNKAAEHLRARIASTLYNSTTGLFMDGVGFPHSAVHASIVAAAAGVVKVNSSRCPLCPHTTPYTEEKSILGVIYRVLRRADMNTATPLGARGRSAMSLGGAVGGDGEPSPGRVGGSWLVRRRRAVSHLLDAVPPFQ